MQSAPVMKTRLAVTMGELSPGRVMGVFQRMSLPVGPSKSVGSVLASSGETVARPSTPRKLGQSAARSAAAQKWSSAAARRVAAR